MDTIYAKRRWLMGATCQFHVQLSIHIQALIQGGVFDRFPGAKIIVGHLGENLVSIPPPRLSTILHPPYSTILCGRCL